jgi:hypothetical protein
VGDQHTIAGERDRLAEGVEIVALRRRELLDLDPGAALVTVLVHHTALGISGEVELRSDEGQIPGERRADPEAGLGVTVRSRQPLLLGPTRATAPKDVGGALTDVAVDVLLVGADQRRIAVEGDSVAELV